MINTCNHSVVHRQPQLNNNSLRHASNTGAYRPLPQSAAYKMDGPSTAYGRCPVMCADYKRNFLQVGSKIPSFVR